MRISSSLEKDISSYSTSYICNKALKNPSKYLTFAKEIIEVKQGIACSNLILASEKQERKIKSKLLKYEKILNKLNGVSNHTGEKKSRMGDNFSILNNLMGEKRKIYNINEKISKHNLLLSGIEKSKCEHKSNVIEVCRDKKFDFLGEGKNKTVSGDKPVAYPRTVFYKSLHTKKIPVPTPRNLTERKNPVPIQEENVQINSCMSDLQHQIVNNKVFISWNQMSANKPFLI